MLRRVPAADDGEGLGPPAGFFPEVHPTTRPNSIGGYSSRSSTVRCPLLASKKAENDCQGKNGRMPPFPSPPGVGSPQGEFTDSASERVGGIRTVGFRCDRFRECPLIATDVGVHQCWTPQKKSGRQCANLTSPSMTIGGSNVLLSPSKGASDCDAPLMVSIVWISLMPIRDAALPTAHHHAGSKRPRTDAFLKRGCLACRISSKMRP